MTTALGISAHHGTEQDDAEADGQRQHGRERGIVDVGGVEVHCSTASGRGWAVGGACQNAGSRRVGVAACGRLGRDLLSVLADPPDGPFTAATDWETELSVRFKISCGYSASPRMQSASGANTIPSRQPISRETRPSGWGLGTVRGGGGGGR